MATPHPTFIMERLAEGSPVSSLTAWVYAHQTGVQGAIGRASAGYTPRVLAPVGYGGEAMSYDAAVAWMLRAAEGLADTTHFDSETGAMLKDETGASGSTHAQIDAYRTHSASSPSMVHMAGAEILRVHSGTQLDRKAWEAAYTAIKARYAADGNAPLPPGQTPTVYRRDASVLSGLKDGTKYSFDGQKVHMRLQLGTEHTSARDLLLSAGIPDSAYTFYAGKGETYKRWIALDPAYVGIAANALEKEYPALAAAIRQNEPSWVERAGVTRKVRAPVEAAGAVPFDPAGATGTGWSWKPTPSGIVLSIDGNLVKFMDSLNLVKDKDYSLKLMGKKPDGANIWALSVPQRIVPVIAARLTAANRGPALAYQLAQQDQHTKQTVAAAGAMGSDNGGEGRWEVRGDGLIKLYTSYNKFAKGWQSSLGLAWDKDGGREGKGAFHWLIRPAQTATAAAAMRPHWPILADALEAAFAHVAQTTVIPTGDDAPVAGFGAIPVCAAQSDLAHAAEIADVTNPAALAAIADVQRALTQRLPVGVEPYPYQIIGAAFGKLAGYRYLNGDAMGVGKTITTLCNIAVDPEKLLPAAIIVPSSVTLKWAAECKKWLPSVPVHIVRKGKDALPPAGWKGIVIMGWSLLDKFVDGLSAWGVQFFVGDEIHYIKNPASGRAQAARRLARQAPYAAFLSGTPLLNRLTELWHPLSCLDEAAWGGTITRFQRQYMESEKSRFGTTYSGIKNKKDLVTRLSCIMVNRLKSQVAKWLPDKTRNLYTIDIDTPAEKQAFKEYKFVEENFRTFVTGKYEQKAEALYQLMISSGIPPAEARERSNEKFAGKADRAANNEQLTVLGYLRQALGKLKVAPVLTLAAEILNADEPLVLYAEFHATIKLLKEGLAKLKIGENQRAPRVVVIDGKLNADKKYAAWTGFQNGDYDVVIGSSAMREGIDLFRASQGIFVERWWVPALETQAEDRMHRNGQKNAVTVWYPTVADTIDEHMAALAEKKRAVLDAVLGSEDVDIEHVAGNVTESITDYLSGGKGEKPKYSKKKNSGGMPDMATSKLPPPSTIHALMFNKSAWSGAAASHWAKMHGLTNATAEPSGAHYRVVCRDAGAFRPGTFRPVRVTATVTALVAQPGRR